MRMHCISQVINTACLLRQYDELPQIIAPVTKCLNTVIPTYSLVIAAQAGNYKSIRLPVVPAKARIQEYSHLPVIPAKDGIQECFGFSDCTLRIYLEVL